MEYDRFPDLQGRGRCDLDGGLTEPVKGQDPTSPKSGFCGVGHEAVQRRGTHSSPGRPLTHHPGQGFRGNRRADDS